MSQAGAFADNAVSIVAVTPSDSTDLTGARAFFTTDGGDVAIKTVYGPSATTAVTISSCPAGFGMPIRLTRIMSTNTTASNIYVVY